jgi:hypothetical protein
MVAFVTKSYEIFLLLESLSSWRLIVHECNNAYFSHKKQHARKKSTLHITKSVWNGLIIFLHLFNVQHTSITKLNFEYQNTTLILNTLAIGL